MGWASGSTIAIELWDLVREDIPQTKRRAVAKEFYDLFCEHDADDWDGGSTLEIDAEISQEQAWERNSQ